jgi:hypothetical protein
VSVHLAHAGILAKQTVGGGSVIDPNDLAPAYWVKPRTLDGTLANGAAVSSITESSAHARVLTSDSTIKPVLTKNAIDGLSVIDFNKTNLTDLHHGLFPDPNVAQPFEVWVVFGLSDFVGDYAGGNRQAIWAGPPGTQPYMILTPGDWDDNADYYAGLYAGSLVDTQLAGTDRSMGMQFHLNRAVLNGASSFLERNGVNVTGSISPGTSDLGGLYLGHSGGFGLWANTRLAELIVVPALSSGDAADLLAYFDATFPSLGV